MCVYVCIVYDMLYLSWYNICIFILFNLSQYNFLIWYNTISWNIYTHYNIYIVFFMRNVDYIYLYMYRMSVNTEAVPTGLGFSEYQLSIIL